MPEGLYGRRKYGLAGPAKGFPAISKATVDRLMRDEGMNGLVRGKGIRTTGPAKTCVVRAADTLPRPVRRCLCPAPRRGWCRMRGPGWWRRSRPAGLTVTGRQLREEPAAHPGHVLSTRHTEPMTRTGPRALRRRWQALLLAALAAELALLLPTSAASAGPASAAQTRVGAIAPTTTTVVGVHECIRAGQRPVYGRSQSRIVVGNCVAAETGGADIVAGRFAQTDFTETFGKKGLFSGRTINGVADDLRSGGMSAKDMPINVVVRDGNTLITNTRSAQALTWAGIPREVWNVINQTGDPLYEKLVSDQLGRNGLTSSGYEFP